jgi:transcriptional antiterminator RfaH
MENSTVRNWKHDLLDDGRQWFCLRSQPKREHIAARNLKVLGEVELFSPRLRTRKITRRGPIWFVESLFPNYLFARFPFAALIEEVKFTPGISHIVHFGGRYPAIPAGVITELQEQFREEDLQLGSATPDAGDLVTVTEPKFFGLQAKVLRILPARERVQVLLEMLGRTAVVELNLSSVVPENRPLPEGLRATISR